MGGRLKGASDAPGGGRTGGRLARVGGMLSSAAWVVVGFAFLTAAPAALIDSLVWPEPLASLPQIPWLIVYFYGVGAGVLLLAGVLVTVLHRDDPARDWPSLLVVALVIVAGPCLAVLFLGSLLLRLADDGLVIMHEPTQTTATAQDVFRQLSWEGVDVIPLIELPETMGWSRPVPDPAWPLGMAAMAIRLVMLLIVVWAAREVWVSALRGRRERVAEPDRDPS